jgi:arsenite-transporting ATPase
VVATIAEALATLQREHRLVREQLAWTGRPEAADRLIHLLASQAEGSGALLRDSQRTSVNWVLLPEELSVAESHDGLAALHRARITVAALIVNRLTPPGPPCPVCDRRRSDHARIIARLPRRLGKGMSIHLVPEETYEPRGVAALARLAGALAARKPASFTVDRSSLAVRRMAKGGLRKSAAERHSRTGAWSRTNVLNALNVLNLVNRARLVFFVGKGGAGKTTCAAATAIRMAIAEPHRRVRLLSTDPAHSLADLFGTRLTGLHAPQGSPPNLRVQEVDAAAILDQRRDRLERALTEIAETFAPRLAGVSVDRGVRELIALAPPGTDELLAMLSVIEVQDSDDRLVVDMAPTGHALRLLEMPDVAREWVQALMRMLLKYRSLVRPAKLGAELVELSRSIRRLQGLLADSRSARFFVITRAAELSRLETERLVARLRGLRLSVSAVIVNAMTPSPTGCRRCRAIATSERAQLARFVRRRKPGECAIILTPLVAPPPRGARALDRWARSWIAAEKDPSYMKSLARRSKD